MIPVEGYKNLFSKSRKSLNLIDQKKSFDITKKRTKRFSYYYIEPFTRQILLISMDAYLPVLRPEGKHEKSSLEN